jgi:hypothetical protein
MLDIVVIDDEFIHMFAKRLAQDAHGLSGRHYVSIVLRYYLVDHGCDTPIESIVVHSPFVEQVERGCKGRQALFLIFLSNVSYA